MITFEQIQNLASLIAQAFQPEKIILYGSYAYGNPRQDSDVDLLIIMPVEGNPIDKGLEIRHNLQLPKYAHLLVKPPEEVAWRYEGYDPLVRTALEDGKLLYGQP